MRTSPLGAPGPREEGAGLYGLRVAPSATMRRRRLGMLLAAAFIFPFAFLDLALPNGRSIAPVGIAWAGTLFAASLFQREGHPRPMGKATRRDTTSGFAKNAASVCAWASCA